MGSPEMHGLAFICLFVLLIFAIPSFIDHFYCLLKEMASTCYLLYQLHCDRHGQPADFV